MEFTEIIDLFCEVLSIDDEGIDKTTGLTEEYGFEPIDIAKLVIAAEERFGIVIHDEDVASFKTIGDMADYIQKNLPEPAFLPEHLIYR